MTNVNETTETSSEERRARTDGPVHSFFGLSYSNYQVVPRTLAQSMPVEWQERFVACMRDLRDAFTHIEHPAVYTVQAADECPYDDLSDDDMRELGITRVDIPEDVEGAAQEPNIYRDRDGIEHEGHDYLTTPTSDPIPHYNRGRTFIEPRQ
jgi:hypothetical protein